MSWTAGIVSAHRGVERAGRALDCMSSPKVGESGLWAGMQGGETEAETRFQSDLQVVLISTYNLGELGVGAMLAPMLQKTPLVSWGGWG